MCIVYITYCITINNNHCIIIDNHCIHDICIYCVYCVLCIYVSHYCSLKAGKNTFGGCQGGCMAGTQGEPLNDYAIMIIIIIISSSSSSSTYIYISISLSIYIYMYVSLSLYIYIYIYVCIHIFTYDMYQDLRPSL